MNTPDLNSAISVERLAELETKLEEMRQLLSFAVGLTPTDRRRYQALGRQRIRFVQLSLENIRLNPDLVPPYQDSNVIWQNYEIYLKLVKIQETINQIARLLSDTVHYSGSQLTSDALTFYSTVKRAAKTRVPGAQSVSDSLKNSLKKAKPSGGSTTDVPVTGQTVA